MTRSGKAGFPYLVDIGVTTMCSKGCKFCSAGATPAGRHADRYFLSSVLPDSLFNANVFEVVLGGYGEPTLYRDPYNSGIDMVIRSFKDKGFKVGMTTANYEWNESIGFHTCIQGLNSVAISCNDPSDLTSVIALAKAINDEKMDNPSRCYGPEVSIQTIAGIMPWKDTMGMLRTATEDIHIRNVTILGLHNCGRGKNIKPKVLPKDWLGDLRTLEGVSVGIDATMAGAWRDQLLKAGIESYRLAGAEGLQTCFIDAVSQTIRPSSFSDVRYSWETARFLEIFSKL